MSLLPGVWLSAPERQRSEMQSAEMKVNVIASSFVLAVLAFVGAPVIAQDASGVQSVVSVEGWVPVICQASAPDLHPAEGISGTVRFVGTLEEICKGGSYQVWLENDAGNQGLADVENAKIGSGWERGKGGQEG